MTLSALGFIGGEKVMLETQITDGSTDVSWPRHRYIEEPNFRDFREGDRLDAMDYQGRWFSGQVISLTTLNRTVPHGTVPYRTVPFDTVQDCFLSRGIVSNPVKCFPQAIVFTGVYDATINIFVLIY